MSISSAILQSYGVMPPSTTKVPGEAKKLAMSDAQVLHAQISLTDDERRFLNLHAKALKMGRTDRMKQKGSFIINAYLALPFLMKMLLLCVAIACFMFMLPTIVWMGVNILQNKLAMAKILILVFFTAVVFFGHVFVVALA
jgi:hypothetical protein